MFDIGFSEMLLIAVVALVVIGPERLPAVARNVGQFLGRLQRYVSDVKRDFNREVEFEEIRRLQQEMETTVQSMQASMKSVEESLQQEIKPREAMISTTLEQAQQNLDALRTQVERLEGGGKPQNTTESLVSPDTPKPRKSRVGKKLTSASIETPVKQEAVSQSMPANPDDEQYRLF